MSVALILSTVLSLAGFVILLGRSRRFNGTTLVAPYRWTLFSLFVLAVSDAWLILSDASQTTFFAIRYLGATTSFCPLMAVLGAKRPQNVGWQLIVGTLWIVMILPVVETMLLWSGGTLDIGAMRSWMLVVLMGVGLSNYALTKFGMAVAIATLGQGVMLAPHLPLVRSASYPSYTMGFACIVFALGFAWYQSRRVRVGVRGWSRVWCDFRDAFGLVWGLRVMERVNSAARLSGWKTELTWHGFAGENDVELGSDDHLEISRAMRTTLRRFVSSEWIDERLGSKSV